MRYMHEVQQHLDPFAPATRKARPIAFDFVLDELAPLSPTTRAMFGATAVYVEERVVFILRQKGDADDGVWVAFEPELEAALIAELPSLQRIDVLGNVRSWRKLAARSETFEEDVLHACRMLRAGDARIGKVPERTKARRKARAAAKEPKPRPRPR